MDQKITSDHYPLLNRYIQYSIFPLFHGLFESNYSTNQLINQLTISEFAAKLLIQLTLNVRAGIQLLEFSLYTKYDTDLLPLGLQSQHSPEP